MEGSGYKVPLTQILEIKEHPNADRLEIAVVYGFEVVVGKGSYKTGDTVIYIPIDSILPQDLEDHLFPEGSKIKLTKHTFCRHVV
jgi:RNA ligase (TIGR02306 family)